MSWEYGEEHLVQLPAQHRMGTHGWKEILAYDHEDFGPNSLLGRDDKSQTVLLRSVRRALKQINGDWITDEQVEEAIAKINEMEVDDIQKEYEDAISTYISDNHVDGILDAVASFNIQDMSNMAESLISITNLHRHFSSSEESVGGPVEVAVITRGGGFQWVKHQLA